MASPPSFPTTLHEQVAELACEFFLPHAQVDTFLVVNSCARGHATPDSDLDLGVLVDPAMPAAHRDALLADWQRFAAIQPAVMNLAETSRFGHVHLDLLDGQFKPEVWDDGGGPDGFELGIGNAIAYSAPLREPGPYFRQLQQQWLPYYDDALRLSRLTMVRSACVYDLSHVPFYVGRGLYFQAFDRLYRAFQEFLQALFIARRTYPLAYNKWIRMQVAEWLGLPELYQELPAILSVQNLESEQMIEKTIHLHALLERWASPGALEIFSPN